MMDIEWLCRKHFIIHCTCFVKQKLNAREEEGEEENGGGWSGIFKLCFSMAKCNIDSLKNTLIANWVGDNLVVEYLRDCRGIQGGSKE